MSNKLIKDKQLLNDLKCYLTYKGSTGWTAEGEVGSGVEKGGGETKSSSESVICL